MARKSYSGILIGVVVAVLLVLAGTAWLARVRVGPPPAVTITPEMPAIGMRTRIGVALAEPERGLSDFTVELVQGERSVVLAEEHHEPRPFWAFSGPLVDERQLTVEVGYELQDWLVEGDASIRVIAARAPSWLNSPRPILAKQTLPVRLRPPTLDVVSTQIYAAQGGCEAIVYRVGPTAVKDGVRAGSWWFPGHPLPGSTTGERFVLFAVPYDLDDRTQVRLIGSDEIGNQANARAIDIFVKKPLKTDTIQVSDSFMQRVVPAIFANTPGLVASNDLLEDYLAINRDLRARNARTLVELAERSVEEFLWSKPFLQMPNTKVTSAFADRRTYLYDGRTVDTQDHLGFDLASTQRAPVPAANDGIVVMAEYFGIYGNTVVIDHGYALMTLYGHLSTIDVDRGQKVARGDVIGTSGETGLAGGDHLHFTTLLGGLPVNPTEWWDAHWIRDRLKKKLGDALPFTG